MAGPVWTPLDLQVLAQANGAQALANLRDGQLNARPRDFESYISGMLNAPSAGRAAPPSHAEQLDELIATESDGAMLNFLVAQRCMRQRTGRWFPAS